VLLEGVFEPGLGEGRPDRSLLRRGSKGHGAACPVFAARGRGDARRAARVGGYRERTATRRDDPGADHVAAVSAFHVRTGQHVVHAVAHRAQVACRHAPLRVELVDGVGDLRRGAGVLRQTLCLALGVGRARRRGGLSSDPSRRRGGLPNRHGRRRGGLPDHEWAGGLLHGPARHRHDGASRGGGSSRTRRLRFAAEPQPEASGDREGQTNLEGDAVSRTRHGRKGSVSRSRRGGCGTRGAREFGMAFQEPRCIPPRLLYLALFVAGCDLPPEASEASPYEPCSFEDAQEPCGHGPSVCKQAVVPGLAHHCTQDCEVDADCVQVQGLRAPVCLEGYFGAQCALPCTAPGDLCPDGAGCVAFRTFSGEQVVACQPDA
jgi:hypothetical protein